MEKRRFQVVRGPRAARNGAARLHPAIQLRQIWTLDDPEYEGSVDFVELFGHWCCEIKPGQPTRCPHLVLDSAAFRAINRPVSIALSIVDVIEECEGGACYWLAGRTFGFFVASGDNAVGESGEGGANETD